MPYLIAGLALFLAIHILPIARGLRRKLGAESNKNLYKLGFSIVSATGLGLIVYGKSQAEVIPLWEPPVWGRHTAWMVLLAAFIMLAATYGSSILRHLRHPMLLGVMLWGAGHLFANGDLASLLLFGGMAVFSAIMIVLLVRRDGSAKPVQTSSSATFIQAFAGILIYFCVLILHEYLFGVSAV